MDKIWQAIFLLLVSCLWIMPALAAQKAQHVFIISFDGGKPSVMKQSHMPVLTEMLQNGAYTWHAQTVFPSITLVTHTSMLTGLQPDKHLIDWNEWIPERGLLTVPTIFSLAHQKHLNTAMFVGKEKFKHLELPNSLNKFEIPNYFSKQLSEAAAKYIVKEKPNLCFIHFADSDGAGHGYGWGSEQQIQSFANEDQALSTIIKAIKQAGIEGTSVVICTADHGGHDKTHGSKSPEDMNIPWITWGENVKHNFAITAPVSTCDTAATALWLLDVPLPKNFDGKPVTSAFAQKK